MGEKKTVFRSDLCVMILLEMIYVLRMHLQLCYDIHYTTKIVVGNLNGQSLILVVMNELGKHLVMLSRYRFFFVETYMYKVD